MKEAKMYLHTFVSCFVDHFRLVSDFRQIPRRKILKFLHSLSTASFAAGISSLEAWEYMRVSNCNDAVNCHLTLQYGLHEHLAQFLLFTVFWFHLLLKYMLIWMFDHLSEYRVTPFRFFSFCKA